MKGTFLSTHLCAAALAAASALAPAACAAACAPPPVAPSVGAAVPPGPSVGESPSAALLGRFKAAGKGAPLTVLPARLGGAAMPQVGEFIALMLERGGMTALETSPTAFTPPSGADMAQTARAFAEFVKATPPTTEYALYAEFLGTPQSGATEVRGIVVTARGEIAWQTRLTKGDPAFDRAPPREPMECCMLVVSELRPVLGLQDPSASAAPEGRIARQWKERTGLPTDTERQEIERRGIAFRKAAADATLAVYPVRAGDAYSGEGAAHIAALVNARHVTKARAIEGLQLQVAPSMNQQKVLWDMAHALSAAVKRTPPDTDYALYAQYVMGKDAVSGVNVAICNRQGELVWVDFQNSHWPDFQAIDPRDREGCDALVAKRLEAFCR